jgi:branched-chain amino acid transport system permease protein
LLTLLLNDILFVRMLGKDIAVSVLATAGLLLTIDNAVLAVFGGEPASIDAPTAETVEVLGLAYPAYRLVAAGIAICVLVAVGAFLKFTRYGLFMRAVPQSRELAAATGVPMARVNALTIALGGLTAGMAGALAAPITGAHFQMGLAILAPSFIVVVIGGLGNLTGTVVIAIMYGLIRGLFSTAVSPTMAEAATLLSLLPILYLRPQGLFGGR